MAVNGLDVLETISRECFRSFAVLPDAAVIEDDDATGVVTSIPLTFFNGIGVSRLEPSGADLRIEELIEPFRARDRAFRWWVLPTSAPPDLARLLAAHGFRKAYDSAGMVADLGDLPRERPEASIARVTSDGEMKVFADVLTTVFERPQSDTAYWRGAYGAFGYGPDAPWAHFVAFVGDTPAATASVLLCGEVTGVYLVGTLPMARGRGLGSAVTLAALQHARERGARYAALQSSEMAESIYRSLGFATLCTLPLYEWRP
jgi:GNAT superfamily N-acetyltransferase